MFGLLFLAHNFSRCLPISCDLHSAAEFLDGWGVVNVVDKVDNLKYLFLLLLTGLWISSFSSNQLLILSTADSSSQRPCSLFQILPLFLDSGSFCFILCRMLPFHKWRLFFQFCNSNPFSYGSFLSWWVARLWPARFWWGSTWMWFLPKWRLVEFSFEWLFPSLQPVVYLVFEGTKVFI